MKTHTYRVEYKTCGGGWVYIGLFRSRSECGAIAQAMRDARHFPNLVAVRAELA